VKRRSGGTDSAIEMSDGTVSQRLSQARAQRGEALPALAKRIGVREEYLRAIEEGRLADLPSGIYGRAAIRAFARDCGFDPAEILAACESLLTPLEEPIAALGKLRGVRQPNRTAPPPAAETNAPANPPVPATSSEGRGFPDWRPVAAAALDGCLVAMLLLLVVVCTMTAMIVPVGALDGSGAAFALMGVLLGVAYFGCFGGLGGQTAGARLLRVEPETTGRGLLTLRAVVARALRSATDDARFIRRLGAWMGELRRKTTGPVSEERNAPRPAPLPWPPRPHGPGPARS
jgi:transcriptional regulator with XRE-family HTH domain